MASKSVNKYSPFIVVELSFKIHIVNDIIFIPYAFKPPMLERIECIEKYMKNMRGKLT